MSTPIIDDGAKNKKETPVFKPISPKQLKQLCDAVDDHCGAKFLMVHCDDIRALDGDGDAAILLSYYLNEFRMKYRSAAGKKALADSGSWFKSPTAEIRDRLGMSYKKVKRCADALSANGVVEVCHWRGNVIWVRINMERLIGLRSGQAPQPTDDEPETPDQIRPKGESSFAQRENLVSPKGRNSTNKKRNNNNSASGSPAATPEGTEGSFFGQSSSAQPSGAAPNSSRAGHFLSKLLARQQLLGSPKRYNLAEWEKEFAAIEQDLVASGYDESDAASEVTTILELYGNRAGSDRFLCKAYSGKSFREKYTSIRAYFIDRKEYIPDHEFLMGEEMPEIVESYKEYHPDGSFTIKFKEDGQ